MSRKMFFSAMLLLCLIMQVKDVLGVDEEKRLMRNLFDEYDQKLRPVPHHNEALNVTMTMELYQLLEINEKEEYIKIAVTITQEWIDFQLKWNASDYNGLKEMNIPSNIIWKPDIMLYNNINEDAAEYGGNLDMLTTQMILHTNGRLKWMAPTILRARCFIDVQQFPFDKQHCYFKFGSWTYDMSKINIFGHYHKHQSYHQHQQWDLIECNKKRNEVEYKCCPGHIFPDVTFHSSFQRKSLFYKVNLVFPIVIITLLTILTFVLPAESGERLSVAVTLLLAVTVFMLLIAEMMPESNESVPLLGIFFMFCIIEISCIIVALCCVTRFYHGNNGESPMGKWTRKYILEKLSYVLRVRKTNRKVTNVASKLRKSSEGENGTSPKKDAKGKQEIDIRSCMRKLLHNEQKTNRTKHDYPFTRHMFSPYRGVEVKTINDFQLSREEEWCIVAKTVERCLFVFFTASYIIGSITILVI